MPHTVHLVDASPYIFRAYFSLPSSLKDPAGNPINAVRGFGDFLLRLVAEEGPTHLGVAFDESLTTSFRNEIYPPYKAQRELPPAELEAQLEACQDLAAALGAETWVDDRYEADDLIATAAAKLRRKGHRVIVVTSDKDLAQLVDAGTELLDFAKGARLGPDEVVEKLGVRPEQVADYLGLAGDSVDNIPGVKGVGAKTAAALLAAFEDLDELYDELERVAELPIRGAKGLGAKLEAERETAFLSRELATVAMDAPARTDLRRLAYKGADAALLDPLLERLGMDRLRQRVARWK